MTISKKKLNLLENGGVRIFDDKYRGDCPKERIEQVNFISWLRFHYPHVIAFHPVNEGDVPVQKRASLKEEGLLPGVSDVIILHKTKKHPYMVLEMKRKDSTKSRISDDQVKFLIGAADQGAFACVACGFECAKDAFLSCINE